MPAESRFAAVAALADLKDGESIKTLRALTGPPADASLRLRAAALVAARPQPDLVGQEQRHAALADMIQHQQRLAVGGFHHHLPVQVGDIDVPIPLAP